MHIKTDKQAIFKETHFSYFQSEIDQIKEKVISYDMRTNKFTSTDNIYKGTVEMFNNEIAQKKVSIGTYADKDNNICKLMSIDGKPFIATCNNKMVSLTLYNAENFSGHFDLCCNLKHFYAFKLKCLPSTFDPYYLRTAYLPMCRTFKESALDKNHLLRKLYAPALEKIENFCLRSNKHLTEFIAPNVKYIGDAVLCHNEILNNIDIRNVEYIGDCFLHQNKKLQQLYIPKCKEIAEWVLLNNQILNKLYIPSVNKIGNDFLLFNLELAKFVAPELLKAPLNILSHNAKLKTIHMDRCEKIEKGAFHNKPAKTPIHAPHLKGNTPYPQCFSITNKFNALMKESMGQNVRQ